MTERVRFSTKNSLVEEAIRRAILDGEVAPGDWLRPDDWSQRLGVSPTPVREALQRLEAQGLVAVYPHRGAQVAGFDLSDFIEMYHIRAALEGLGVYLAVERTKGDAHQALIAKLTAINEAMIAAGRESRWADVRRGNHDFHMAIYAAAGSPRLEQMIRNLWITFPWESLTSTMAEMPGRLATVNKEHNEMIDAVRRGDPKPAGDLMARHVEASAEGLLRHAERVGMPLWEPQSRRILADRREPARSGGPGATEAPP